MRATLRPRARVSVVVPVESGAAGRDKMGAARELEASGSPADSRVGPEASALEISSPLTSSLGVGAVREPPLPVGGVWAPGGAAMPAGTGRKGAVVTGRLPGGP